MLRTTNFYLFFFLFLISCQGNNDQTAQVDTAKLPKFIEFYGNTQGTTYAIMCNDSITIEKAEITAILANFDQALSGYIPTSIVTRLNENPAGDFTYTDPNNYFNRCFELSKNVYALTEGCFDPTVYPLVEGWGFMKNVAHEVLDSSVVDSLKSFVGFQDGYHFEYLGQGTNEEFPNQSLIKKNTPNAKLDFNAIAQGLAVDVIAEELEKRGAVNYFVEIGGEIRVSGVNSEGKTWRIGIDKPIDNSTEANRQLQEIIHLKNKSVATSGSYRKFYEKNGEKYAHTLNPKTGYPVTHNLLSATVVHKSCAFADAMATAFMVMGPQQSIDFIQTHRKQRLEAYLIYTENGKEKVFMSKGFKYLLSK